MCARRQVRRHRRISALLAKTQRGGSCRQGGRIAHTRVSAYAAARVAGQAREAYVGFSDPPQIPDLGTVKRVPDLGPCADQHVGYAAPPRCDRENGRRTCPQLVAPYSSGVRSALPVNWWDLAHETLLHTRPWDLVLHLFVRPSFSLTPQPTGDGASQPSNVWISTCSTLRQTTSGSLRRAANKRTHPLTYMQA